MCGEVGVKELEIYRRLPDPQEPERGLIIGQDLERFIVRGHQCRPEAPEQVQRDGERSAEEDLPGSCDVRRTWASFGQRGEGRSFEVRKKQWQGH